jgi:hypothetical protein
VKLRLQQQWVKIGHASFSAAVARWGPRKS